VDGTDPKDRLPEAYANALRLRDEGFDAFEIAQRLDVPAEAVPSLLRLAERKLAALPDG
jgi:DNA-directed RNA polymerase specialized sigma24 family protein